MSRLSYEGRWFTPVHNTGEAGGATLFHYRQRGDVVWATYAGGAIVLGTLVARVDADGSLTMGYQHINAAGELRSGRCHSIPTVLADGRIRLDERWAWTGGEEGESVLEEIAPPAGGDL